jgi:hypothetical protein
MFKYEDEGMKRKNRVYVSLTDDELLMLHNYKIQIRAPSLSMALATLVKNGAKMVQLCTNFQETNNERKERSKEKEETKKELCLVDLAIDDASRDATNAKKNLSLEERKNAFWQRLVPYIQKGTYPQEMVAAFYRYWTEINENGRRMRFEKEKTYELPKRLATWQSREMARSNGRTAQPLSPEQIADQLRTKRRREEASDQLLAQYDEIAQNAVSYKDFKNS